MQNWTRYIIGAIEILGGAMGAVLALLSMLNGGPRVPIGVMIGAVYVLSIVAGVQLVRNKASGRPLSLISQATQLLAITATSLSFRLTSGLGLWLWFGSQGFHRNPVIGSEYHIDWQRGFGSLSQNHPFEMGINVLAAGLILYLFRSRDAGMSQIQSTDAQPTAAPQPPSEALVREN